MESDGVVLYRTFDENRVELSGEVTKENIEKLIAENLLPLLVYFDQEVGYLFDS